VLDAFFTESSPEVEKRNRIRLTVAAYAYEFHDDPIMSDGEFDELAKKIRPEIKTGDTPKDKIHDEFFAEEFSPDTGQWIHKHPFPGRVEWLYRRGKQLKWWNK
jgi:hypothetical protein